jgi:putative pyruvate formate lyase activating enzyme
VTVPHVPHVPAYRSLLPSGELDRRVEQAIAGLACCHGCPRACGVDRLAGETGICGTGRDALASSAFPHPGEEACLRGRNGSGTIFFASCSLRCVFCQNHDISQEGEGRPATASEIAGMMLRLQEFGCHNINWVTPSHVVPQLIEALALAARRGLAIPIVYNTSAYDALESLALLDGLIDVYMPDFKFWEPETAYRFAGARDYPERARAAILEMHRQVGVLRCGPDGVATRGVLVRHLLMPGQEEEARAIFRWLAEALAPDTAVHVMDQYRPAHLVGQRDENLEPRYADIDRLPSAAELAAAYRAADDAGLAVLRD